MTMHMQRELEKLKKMILALSAVVEEAVQQAVLSLVKRDVALAEKVVAGDEQVDRMEVDLEEECLKILALHQPVAADLRFIVSVLKINNDLERIADLATNVAERTVGLASVAHCEFPFDLEEMATKVETMLEKALDALVNLDLRLATEVTTLDDEVDSIHKQNYTLVKNQIRRFPERLDALVQYLSISRHLERIADLATNIAEDVTYMIEGEIVRHGL
ncbi:phosphate signaling complex protein PhoU [Desulfuromonas carbonis]|uniref:phosphate signaling complex protein PhoU n=1 Tax=Desulfuromonas sp. DDH964 TaxID=1823759 RepID=UPI00078C2697|nr:phosphate signaling complex protein PhoU [Desulfuromonas sp. DDH964]AMV70990.1 phosphate transport system regulatory protein PhoU [Desulfuromonas sp. DDH964]